MPGRIWSEKELATLQSLRQIGLSVPEILAREDILPGRSNDAIRQQLRRKKWVDPKLSLRAKQTEHMDDQTHESFILFLRAHGAAPIEQLVLSWNNWAQKKKIPKVTASRVHYWVKKLNIPHLRSSAWASDFSRRKRARRRAESFKMRVSQLERKIDDYCRERKAEARLYRRKHPQISSKKCQTCKMFWPFAKEFFTGLPNSFSFGGSRLNGLQSEFCAFCQITRRWELIFYRSFGMEWKVKELLNQRRDALRRALDKACELFIKQARLERDEQARHFSEEMTPCARCQEPWPLTHFHENRGLADGTPTYRGICVFCDGWYSRQIDRVLRDKGNASILREERKYYLSLARRSLVTINTGW